jgi:hypothetical protein
MTIIRKRAGDGLGHANRGKTTGLGHPNPGGHGGEGPEDEENPIEGAAASVLLGLLGLPEVLHHAVESMKTAQEMGFGGFENAMAAEASAVGRMAAQAINPNAAQAMRPSLAFLPAAKPSLSNWRQARMGLALPSSPDGLASSPSASNNSDEDQRQRRRKKIG